MNLKNSILKINPLIILTFLCTNCIYQTFPDDYEREKNIIGEEPIDSFEKPDPTRTLEYEEKLPLDEYYHNVIRERYNFTFEDYLKLERINKKKPYSYIDEAIIAAGIFHRLKLFQTQQTSNFGSSSLLNDFSLGTNNQDRSIQDNDIEELERLYGINLIEILDQNRLVNNLHFINLALAALNSIEEKTYRAQKVFENIKLKLKYWQFVSQKFFPEKETVLPPIEDLSEVMGPVEPTGVKPALPFEGSELSQGERLIMEASNLVEQNEYYQAIVLLNKIKQNSPLYSTVLEKKKLISNAGVTDLRKKAAKAFQSAIPVTDHKARTAYLQKAKEYLEEAARLFPDSEHQKSVEENLNIIKKNIEIIQYEEDS